MYPNIPGPCGCPTLVVDPPPPNPPCTDCLYARLGNVFCQDSIHAYTDTGQIPVTVWNCADYSMEVVKAPPAFTAGVNVDNMLQLTTNPLYAASSIGQALKVHVRVICNSGTHAGRSVITYANVCIKNRCATVSCAPGYVCNPQTGECELQSGNLMISNGSSEGYGGLSIS